MGLRKLSETKIKKGSYPDVRFRETKAGPAPYKLGELDEARGLVAQGISPAKAKKKKKAEDRQAGENTLEARAKPWYHAKATARSASLYSAHLDPATLTPTEAGMAVYYLQRSLIACGCWR